MEIYILKWIKQCEQGLGSYYQLLPLFVSIYFYFLQVIISASWIFGLILCLPDFLVKDFCKSYRACVANWPLAHAWMPKAYMLFWTVLIAAIPVSVMTVLYSRVIFTLWLKPSQAIAHDPSEQVRKGEPRIPNNDFFLLRELISNHYNNCNWNVSNLHI